jgi:hypothetical protein
MYDTSLGESTINYAPFHISIPTDVMQYTGRNAVIIGGRLTLLSSMN